MVNKFTQSIFWLTLTLVLVGAAWRVNQLATHLDAAIVDTHRRLDGTSQNVNAALIQLGLTLDEVRRASIEQRRYWRRTSVETEKTVHAARELIAHTDSTLNGSVLPAAGDAAKRFGESADSLSATLTKLEPSLDGLQRAVGNVETVTGNPAINDAVNATAASAKNVSEATANLSNATRDIEEKVHQMTRPASWWKNVGMTILDLGSKVGTAVTGWLK